MTIVGIISDTHIRIGGKRVIPAPVWDAFQNVDLILHGGDLTALEVLEELSTRAPVLAVKGNNDTVSPLLPKSRRVEIERVVIGLVHGDLPANNRRVRPLEDAPGNRETAANAVSHFEFDDDVSCIVFGHSHRPFLQDREIGDGKSAREILLLNPGSPTDKRYATHFGVALLEIDGDHVEPELITW